MKNALMVNIMWHKQVTIIKQHLSAKCQMKNMKNTLMENMKNVLMANAYPDKPLTNITLYTQISTNEQSPN